MPTQIQKTATRIDHAAVKNFITHNYRHFNSAVVIDAAQAYVDHMNTPLLIEHSTEDHRCPLEQAEQLFAALRWRGQEVEMVIYEGENHGLSRGGRPGNRIERVHRIAGWFQKYLGTQPLEMVESSDTERTRG